MNIALVRRVAFLVGALAVGCGDDDGADGRTDGSTGRIDGGTDAPDGGGSGVTGVAHVVQGATAPAPAALTTGAATDGTWYVSPDQITARLTRINFGGLTPETGTGADLVDCVVTYDRAAASLSSLLDCPFSIAPGTYVSMNLFLDPVVEVLISDPGNGIFTDPGSGTGLSDTEPAGGAVAVSVTATLGTGFEQFFSTPLVVADGDTVSLSVVIDAVQSATITVTGGGTSMAFGTYFPAVVFPTVGSAGVPQYYSSAGTAHSYNDSLVLANIVRVYYEPGGTPAYLVFQQRAGELSLCTNPAGSIAAYAADPTETPATAAGNHAGGWLGLDTTDTLCWAFATDGTYQTYANYLTMARAATVGDSTTVRCEQTAAPTPPSSGSTYASGCPAIVTEHSSASLMLVAD